MEIMPSPRLCPVLCRSVECDCGDSCWLLDLSTSSTWTLTHSSWIAKDQHVLAITLREVTAGDSESSSITTRSPSTAPASSSSETDLVSQAFLKRPSPYKILGH